MWKCAKLWESETNAERVCLKVKKSGKCNKIVPKAEKLCQTQWKCGKRSEIEPKGEKL
jgi:hypothetical protein